MTPATRMKLRKLSSPFCCESGRPLHYFLSPQASLAVWIMKKKSESTFPPSGPRFTKEHCFLEVSLALPLCPCKSNSKWKWVSSIARIIMTGKNRSTGLKTSPNATLSPTVFTWTNFGLNPGLRDERPASKSPELCLKHEVRLNNWNLISYRTENSTYPLPINTGYWNWS